MKTNSKEMVVYDFSNINYQGEGTDNCYGTCDCNSGLCDCNCNCDSGDCDCNSYCNN